MTQFINRELVRSGFVRALRVVFESNQDFQYKTSLTDPYQPDDNSGVFIYDAWPWKRIGYPAIIVTLGAADPLLRTIGGEHQSDIQDSGYVGQDGLTYFNNIGEVFGGGVQTTVKIDVLARSAIERSRVMDWLVLYIRHFFTDTFSQQGVSIADMSHAGETMQLVGNEPVYSDALAVTVYSEFQRTIFNGVFGTIDAVSLINVFTLLPNGATASSISS